MKYSFTQQTFEAPHVASALGAAPTSHHRLSAPKERKARGVGVEALFQKCPGRSSWWDGLWSEPPPAPWRSKLWGDLREGSAPQVEGAVPARPSGRSVLSWRRQHGGLLGLLSLLPPSLTPTIKPTGFNSLLMPQSVNLSTFSQPLLPLWPRFLHYSAWSCYT